jgi:glucokinase
MTGHLLADVGGTHTRCGLGGEQSTLQYVRTYKNQDFDGLIALFKQYLSEIGQAQPISITVAVAAPVRGGVAQLTNLAWTIDSTQLLSQFGANRATLINDFVALAFAVPQLSAEDRVQIGGTAPVTEATIGVLGPGTGLGVAGLTSFEDRWVPISSEGGHVTLPAVNAREGQIIDQLRRRYGHVSAERVLSGPGLVTLYETVTGREHCNLTPTEISRMAIDGEPQAKEVLDLFFALLGTVAGNLALTLGARGGIYLGGGILPKLRAQLVQSGFRQRFESKGRFEEYLSEIPVFLITADTPALVGLNYYLRQLLREL